jgi:phosphohistidine phosphatase
MQPRTLIVMRHAKSDWATGAVDDADRPLNARGHRDAPRMGRWLAQQRYVPDYVVASPAVRTLTTAQLVCEALGLDCANVQTDPDIYLADKRQLLRVLARCPDDCRTVLLVGHNPGMEALVNHLAAPTMASGVNLMPTAAVAVIALPADWSQLAQGEGRLIVRMTPKSLPPD